MSVIEDLKKILLECEKTNNYDNYNKRKKDFIDTKIIFNWINWGFWRDWNSLEKLITKSDVEYFYDIIKNNSDEMKKYVDILVKYKVLPVNLFESYYQKLNSGNSNESIITSYIDTFLNKENVKYFVFLLNNKNNYYYKEKIITKILTMDESLIDEDIINKIKNMNNEIDKKHLFKVAEHFEKKITFKELVGNNNFLEHCVDDNLIENFNNFAQEDINYILYYKINKLLQNY